MPNFPFTDLRDAVVDLREKHFPGLHVLPYNRFDVDNSRHWWLSPTNDKQAFRHGKAIFTTDDWVPSGDVFVGYNVEKGLGSSDRSTDPNLMQSDWFWHEFLDRANTPFCSLIEEASKACERPLQLYLQTGPLVPNSDWARVLFDVSGSNLTPVDYNRGDGQVADVASSTDFGQLADSLRAYASGSSDWYWLDVVAGASFTLDPSGVDDTTACAAMLRPFQRWMV